MDVKIIGTTDILVPVIVVVIDGEGGQLTVWAATKLHVEQKLN